MIAFVWSEPNACDFCIALWAVNLPLAFCLRLMVNVCLSPEVEPNDSCFDTVEQEDVVVFRLDDNPPDDPPETIVQ
ncbi:hypothetical protein M514_02529 [Trichuris suis]|uniref:Uncharacterized protein n=1 Tax=Trichuris suis TaxID=68888 RepID=A0A085NNA6_9BILA|nr:hypothetical protein M514_02529 [Trichuris suis]